MQSRISEYDAGVLLVDDVVVSQLEQLTRLAFGVPSREVNLVGLRPLAEWERLVRACRIGDVRDLQDEEQSRDLNEKKLTFSKKE